MRSMLAWMGLLLLLLPGGCAEPTGALLAADAASVVVFGRGLGDLGVSALRGRDCSIVRLDRGQTYCTARDPPMREAYCTRTLATVDCWAAGPGAVLRANVADTPQPTREQVRYREAPWPKSLLGS